MKTKEELQKIGEEVVEVICEIYDPEIPVNIYALGLIYDVEVSEECDVNITMTLTSPNCPVAESLPVEIEEKVKVILAVKKVKTIGTTNTQIFKKKFTKNIIKSSSNSQRRNSTLISFEKV